MTRLASTAFVAGLLSLTSPAHAQYQGFAGLCLPDRTEPVPTGGSLATAVGGLGQRLVEIAEGNGPVMTAPEVATEPVEADEIVGDWSNWADAFQENSGNIRSAFDHGFRSAIGQAPTPEQYAAALDIMRGVEVQWANADGDYAMTVSAGRFNPPGHALKEDSRVIVYLSVYSPEDRADNVETFLHELAHVLSIGMDAQDLIGGATYEHDIDMEIYERARDWHKEHGACGR
ncbi:MAG: hypothetical protein AAGG56_10130 [Pseudomonadota bacterium]